MMLLSFCLSKNIADNFIAEIRMLWKPPPSPQQKWYLKFQNNDKIIIQNFLTVSVKWAPKKNASSQEMA